MKTLTAKDKRTLLFAARHLFRDKSILIPTSISDIHSIPNEQHFSRMLSLTDNRIIYLTEQGHQYFRNVVDNLYRADYFDGLVEYSDISLAWRRVIENWFSNGLAPENADEIVQAIEERILQEIDEYTFVVPLFGVELEDIDSFELGAMSLLRPSIEVFNSARVAHEHADLTRLLEFNKDCLWLKGTMKGTPGVAQQRFSEQAALTIGMLAASAASAYENGAHGFRIGIVMRPEDANGRSVWFSWPERARSLSTHYAFPRGQFFPIQKVFESEVVMSRVFFRALSILQSSKKTELEISISKAVFWYSDAQRDPVLVMKLVKYWSCVESFFSFEKEEITHAVSSGLASILVFGGFRLIPPDEYNTLKKRISKLYSLRSQAVHRGTHQHIKELDVAQFCQWVAWLIFNMVNLVGQGYTTLKEVKEQTDRLDGHSPRRMGGA